MSERTPSKLVFVEKILGIIILIIGVLLSYNTFTNFQAAGLGANLFLAIGIALTTVGLILVIARTKITE